MSALNKDQMAAFRDLWVTYDPECTYYINSSKLERFLEELDPPMGFGRKKKKEQNTELRKEVRHMISQMNLTMYDGNRVFFLDAMHAVGRQVIERDALKKGHSFIDVASTHPVNVAWKQKFLQYTGETTTDVILGEQLVSLGSSSVFVAPNPSPANAAYSLNDIAGWYRKLRDVRDRLKAGRDL